MENLNFHIIPKQLLEIYHIKVEDRIQQEFEKLHENELSIQTFSFYTSVSAVFSSKIEGEDMNWIRI